MGGQRWLRCECSYRAADSLRLSPPPLNHQPLPLPPAAPQVWVYGNSFESTLVAVVVPEAPKLLAWAAAEGLPGDYEVRVWWCACVMMCVYLQTVTKICVSALCVCLLTPPRLSHPTPPPFYTPPSPKALVHEPRVNRHILGLLQATGKQDKLKVGGGARPGRVLVFYRVRGLASRHPALPVPQLPIPTSPFTLKPSTPPPKK
jgi:hypothetical protein